MKKLFLTGKTGFIGKNIVNILKSEYEIVAPTRHELNLLNEDEVKQFLKNGRFDIVLHCANPNPIKNPADNKNIGMLEGSLRIFMNFYKSQDLFGNMFYLGSGAEFDKSRDMALISEDEFGRSVPKDVYGFGKYIMNQLTQTSRNIFNARVFACFGPYDHESKFITHVIRCCLTGKEITIRQNCYFDYIHVSDLGKMLLEVMREQPGYHDYNLCSGKRITLYEIAKIVCEQMGYDESRIVFLDDGWNKEYTGSNQRFMQEHPDFEFLPIEKGIQYQIAWEKENFMEGL